MPFQHVDKNKHHKGSITRAQYSHGNTVKHTGKSQHFKLVLETFNRISSAGYFILFYLFLNSLPYFLTHKQDF